MKSVEKNKLRRDFYVVCTIILLTFTTSILINIDLFYLVLMYLLLPSIYLILRKKGSCENMYLITYPRCVLWNEL